MSQIVIFGTGEIAELADFYFTRDSPHEVAGFAVDAAFLKRTDTHRLRTVASIATRLTLRDDWP